MLWLCCSMRSRLPANSIACPHKPNIRRSLLLVHPASPPLFPLLLCTPFLLLSSLSSLPSFLSTYLLHVQQSCESLLQYWTLEPLQCKLKTKFFHYFMHLRPVGKRSEKRGGERKEEREKGGERKRKEEEKRGRKEEKGAKERRGKNTEQSQEQRMQDRHTFVVYCCHFERWDRCGLQGHLVQLCLLLLPLLPLRPLRSCRFRYRLVALWRCCCCWLCW